MRRLREKRRTSPSPVTVTTPVAPASAAQPVDLSSAPAAKTTPTPAPQPAHAVTGDARRVTLRETEIVHGPGADAFVAPTAVSDGDGDGDAGGKPLVEPEAPAPPPTTSPEEAALLAKGYRKFCELGWGELLGRNQEFVSRMIPPHMQALIVAGGGQMVEESAARLAVKLNIRIPRQDETICVVGGAVAAVGIVGTLRAGNDNTSTKKVGGGDVGKASPPPQASPSPDVTDAELVDEHDDQDDDGRDAGVEPSPSQKARDMSGLELFDL